MTENFLLHEFRLFAPVRIGPYSGYAHLDTGARHTRIMRSCAGTFEHAGRREMRAAFGAAALPQVRINELIFLERIFQDVLADVLPNQAGGFDVLPFNVLAALGSDLLLRHPLYIDFTDNTLAFVDDNLPDLNILARVKVDFQLGPPLFEIIIGDQPLSGVFDTGAAMSVLNSNSLERLRHALTEAEPLEAEDPTGAKFTVPTFRCSGLQLEDFALGESRFLIIDMSSIEQEVGLHLDLVLGVSSMMGRRWLIDRQRGVIEIM